MTTPYIISTPQPPVGTVYPFIGSGTTSGGTNSGDPNGWVLCDGEPRNAPNDDGRYAELAPLLNTYLNVSGNTSNTITPPNFTSRMPIGHTGAASTVMTQGGTGGVMLQASDIPPLTLTVGGSHRHTYARREYFTGAGSAYRPTYRLCNGPPSAASQNTNTANTGINSVKFNNSSQTPVSLLNLYSKVNYIMKY